MAPTPLAFQNSTTVRAKYPSEPPPARLEVLERLWPSLAVRLAEYWFFRPGKRFAALDTSDADVTFEVEVRGVAVTVAGWGRGPSVVAMHGWAGGGAQFELLRRAIVEAGFSFFTYDAPAHGGTPGKSADVGMFSDTLSAVAEHLGHVHAVVGHSLGATAAALCVSRGLSVQGIVMVAPMPSVQFALDGFATLLGLTRATRERLERRATERAGLRPDETSLFSLGSGAPAVLLVHDLSDRMVPMEKTEQLAQYWPHARLVTTERRGHNRVLNDATVAGATTRFLLELHKPRISALDRQLGALDAVAF